MEMNLALNSIRGTPTYILYITLADLLCKRCTYCQFHQIQAQSTSQTLSARTIWRKCSILPMLPEPWLMVSWQLALSTCWTRPLNVVEFNPQPGHWYARESWTRDCTCCRMLFPDWKGFKHSWHSNLRVSGLKVPSARVSWQACARR